VEVEIKRGQKSPGIIRDLKDLDQLKPEVKDLIEGLECEVPAIEEIVEEIAIEVFAKDDKIEELVQMDLSKCQIGRKYEVSIKDAEAVEYKINYMNPKTGSLAMSRPSEETPGKKINVNVNAKHCKVRRYTTPGQQEQDRKDKEERERKAEESAKLHEEEKQKKIKDRIGKRKEVLRQEEIKKEKTKLKDKLDKPVINSEKNETEDIVLEMIKAGIRNIWMVGPAGCGKSTIARIVAEELKRDIHVMSCGIGTSSSEFIGYKYPERESTPFSTFYVKPSIIVLDEFTALDPSVAQIANAALANDELYTTTNLIKRHSDCVIIATSNTFGTGGDMSYVANNQLDASTIDRFVGGIVHVDYSTKYESKYPTEIVGYVNLLRNIIKDNSIQRIASTRMIINAELLSKSNLNWRSMLITNWTEEEKQLLIHQQHV